MGEENRLALLERGLRTDPHAGEPPRWSECHDLEVYDDAGDLLYAGPRYFRCARQECCHLVTHGMVRQGGCWCGNRKLLVALRLTTEEKSRLKRGYYPLLDWELACIQPTLPEGQALGWGKAPWEQQYA
jgi:hypothetical protein